MSWTTSRSSSFSRRCHNNSLSCFIFPLIYSQKNNIGIDSNHPVAYVHVLFVFQMEILMNFWTVIKAYDMFDMKISIGHISWNLRYTPLLIKCRQINRMPYIQLDTRTDYLCGVWKIPFMLKWLLAMIALIKFNSIEIQASEFDRWWKENPLHVLIMDTIKYQVLSRKIRVF